MNQLFIALGASALFFLLAAILYLRTPAGRFRMWCVLTFLTTRSMQIFNELNSKTWTKLFEATEHPDQVLGFVERWLKKHGIQVTALSRVTPMLSESAPQPVKTFVN